MTALVTQAMEIPIPPTGERQLNGYTLTAEYTDAPAAPAMQPTSRAGPPGRSRRRPNRDAPYHPRPQWQGPDLITSIRSVQVSLLDGNGNPYRPGAVSMPQGGPEHVGTFRFNLGAAGRGGTSPGPPAKIIVQLPSDSKDIRVPYHFENIVLP